MKTSLKAGFAQIFSCWPKNLSCPKFGGAAFPLAPRPVRLCAPWITKELIALCKEERSLYKPRRSNKTTIWEKHQRVSEQFCKDTLQNSSMGIHWKTSLRSEKKWKPKPFWNFVKYKRRRTNKLVFLKIDIAVVTDDLCIAQCINSYFLCVFWYPRLRFCHETRKYQL